ncbi:TlpA family protein disulfide reductase [Aeromicrobium terrae]|uniref:Thioredoxin family protein n=1 Tax=Aeromicrobium terrae TaxID=2498846 RepID=A0A5C8NMH8_9ACTN|nr:thioredoxin family protein [Aeromicrobium terrae]TXL62290.1 thioredoxin family protein [Aeromicrobium terrae]
MTGPVFLVAALVVAGVVALVLRRVNGRFRDRPSDELLTPDDIGQSLGERATLLQFSSAFCAPCRATRVLLADVAGGLDGVAHVEVDAESHLDLVRRLDVVRTPTVMILDARGAVVRRASGLPTRDQVLTALS